MTAPARYTFGIAGPADEPEIRALLASTPMPGALSVRFAREPDYFLGCSVMGDTFEVLIAREAGSGELAGVLCRSEQQAFVNGVETTLGGIGGVRIAARHRGQHLLERGWPAFGRRDLLHTGVIADDNPRAVRAMVGRAPGAPTIRRMGGLTTVALLVGRGRRRADPAGTTIARMDPERLDQLADFLARQGQRHQFAPLRGIAELQDGRRMRGLALHDVLVAVRAGRIVGSLACWDQRAFKQDIVDSYGPALRRARPALNVVARAVGAAPLPGAGEMIDAAFGALPLVADDDPVVFDALLDACLALARSRGLAWLMVGLAEADPLLRVARRRLHVTYRASVYAVAWEARAMLDGLDDRCPYVEIATL